MNIQTQLTNDFETLVQLENDLKSAMETYLDLAAKTDDYIANHLDTESRTSQEKQIAALRSNDENFNNDMLEMNLVKHKIDLLKNQLSVISARQRVADTIIRYGGTSNLIEG
jgi:hypothetical protein